MSCLKEEAKTHREKHQQGKNTNTHTERGQSSQSITVSLNVFERSKTRRKKFIAFQSAIEQTADYKRTQTLASFHGKHTINQSEQLTFNTNTNARTIIWIGSDCRMCAISLSLSLWMCVYLCVPTEWQKRMKDRHSIHIIIIIGIFERWEYISAFEKLCNHSC